MRQLPIGNFRFPIFDCRFRIECALQGLKFDSLAPLGEGGRRPGEESLDWVIPI